MEPKAALAAAKRFGFSEVLKPAGFVKGKGCFVRPADPAVGRIIHGIDIQAARYGGEFTINLGFHFDGVPAFFDFVEKPLAEFGLLDFAIQSRLFELRPDLEQWFPYTDDAETAKADLAARLRDTLDAFDLFAARWPDAQSFFTALPPQLFLQEIPNPTPQTSDPEEAMISALWSVFPDYGIDGFQLAVSLCVLAWQAGRPELAAEYAAVVSKQESFAEDRAKFRRFWKRLSQGP